VPPIKTLIGRASRFNVSDRRKHHRKRCYEATRFTEMNGKLKPPTQLANAKDISKGGVKITSMTPLTRNRFAVLELGENLISEHVDKANVLVISKKRILAKVVWRKLNLDTGLFDNGLQFICDEKRKDFELEISKAIKLN
jgi:hypothetical protein